MNYPEDFREELEARRKRLGLKHDESDIDRRTLAMRVLMSNPLEPHEQLFIARLLDPELVAAITKKKKGRGRTASNATKLKADRIAEEYFTLRATGLRRKHKDACSGAGDYFGVSGSRVEKVLQRLDPARRAELERDAAALAKSFAEWEASPAGVARAAEYDALSGSDRPSTQRT